MSFMFNPDGSLKVCKKPTVAVEPKRVIKGHPALLTMIEPKLITAGLKYLEDKHALYFATSDTTIESAMKLSIQNIYLRAQGSSEIGYVAELIEITRENEPTRRLTTEEGKYYYGIKNIRKIGTAIPVIDLVHYDTGAILKKKTDTMTLIMDPY